MSDDFFSKVDFNALISDKKKSSKRLLQITESAIELIYRNGLEAFSYEKLSKECGIARSLIYHYFPTLTDLLIFASSYIRYKYQTYVIEQMAQKKDLVEILRTYIQAALQWVDTRPTDACVWLIYFQKCATSPALADHNRKLVDMGQARLESMLKTGINNQIFALDSNDVPLIARTIQILITGGLLSRATENRTPENWSKETNHIEQICMQLARPLQ